MAIDLDTLLKAEVGEEEERQKPEGADDMASLEFPIDPMRVAPVLRKLISPTRTPARVWDRDGFLVLDSRTLYRRGDFGTDDAAGADAVLHHDRLTDLVRHLLEHETRCEVGPATGGNRHHNPDRLLRRPGLHRGLRPGSRHAEQRQDKRR